ncbi:MAG: RdgB/HAM1 family non-canonical purine NTP pyrophosphatase [Nitrospirae bacterium]|nr:RdgB/HAM1 family non-canonical purine NTP pyrophosphatase [Nitrospirota bacterium]
MELVLATRNPDKLREIRLGLAGLPLTLRSASEIPGVPDVEEDGASYLENATKKALALARATGQWALGDDTGLEVESLGGQPGLYSARYAGVSVSYADNRRLVLQRLAGRPKAERAARFVCVMVVARPDGGIYSAEGVADGYITEQETGAQGFGYDAIFWVPTAGRTYAELTLEQKQAISHRGHALRQIRNYLERALKTKTAAVAGQGRTWW